MCMPQHACEVPKITSENRFFPSSCAGPGEQTLGARGQCLYLDEPSCPPPVDRLKLVWSFSGILC